jgi:hypothetical protein
MSFAVVTGASSGLGEVFARQLAGRGYDLAIAARRGPRLEKLAAQLRRDAGRRVEVVEADLAQAAGRDRLWAATERLGEPVDLLVNNAGFGLGGAFLTLERDRQLEMVSLNCTALTDLAYRYLGPMVARGHGALINVASLAAFQPVPYLGTYAATKAYVLSLTEALEEEVRRSGVRVLCLCPGPVPTEFGAAAGISVGGPVRLVAKSAAACVAEALAGLDAGRVIVVPGIPTSALARTVGLLPRRLVTRIAGAVYRRRIGS